MIGIDHEDVDLAHAILGMNPGADPTDHLSPQRSDIDVVRLDVEDGG
jgi:hypothetical protein